MDLMAYATSTASGYLAFQFLRLSLVLTVMTVRLSMRSLTR